MAVAAVAELAVDVVRDLVVVVAAAVVVVVVVVLAVALIVASVVESTTTITETLSVLVDSIEATEVVIAAAFS